MLFFTNPKENKIYSPNTQIVLRNYKHRKSFQVLLVLVYLEYTTS